MKSSWGLTSFQPKHTARWWSLRSGPKHLDSCETFRNDCCSLMHHEAPFSPQKCFLKVLNLGPARLHNPRDLWIPRRRRLASLGWASEISLSSKEPLCSGTPALFGFVTWTPVGVRIDLDSVREVNWQVKVIQTALVRPAKSCKYSSVRDQQQEDGKKNIEKTCLRKRKHTERQLKSARIAEDKHRDSDNLGSSVFQVEQWRQYFIPIFRICPLCWILLWCEVLSHLRRLGMRKSVGDGDCLAYLCQAKGAWADYVLGKACGAPFAGLKRSAQQATLSRAQGCSLYIWIILNHSFRLFLSVLCCCLCKKMLQGSDTKNCSGA